AAAPPGGGGGRGGHPLKIGPPNREKTPPNYRGSAPVCRDQRGGGIGGEKGPPRVGLFLPIFLGGWPGLPRPPGAPPTPPPPPPPDSPDSRPRTFLPGSSGRG